MHNPYVHRLKRSLPWIPLMLTPPRRFSTETIIQSSNLPQSRQVVQRLRLHGAPLHGCMLIDQIRTQSCQTSRN